MSLVGTAAQLFSRIWWMIDWSLVLSSAGSPRAFWVMKCRWLSKVFGFLWGAMVVLRL